MEAFSWIPFNHRLKFSTGPGRLGFMTGDLLSYHRPTARQLTVAGKRVSYYGKVGVRGYPEPHSGVMLMIDKLGAELGTLVDVTATAGLLAFGARAKGLAQEVTVLEPSRAALRCAEKTFEGMPEVKLSAALPWLYEAQTDTVALAPHTDRGTARVQAEIDGAHALLRPQGRLYAVMHKDQGAKRYEGYLEECFGGFDVLAKRGGWRLARAVKERCEPNAVHPLRFEAAGLKLTAWPGVFAAGKLDPGTKLLLEALDLSSLAGKRVLDLGCGYGLLALSAARAGAQATGVDDDLAAVLSSRSNAENLGLKASLLHSDIDSALGAERFQAVITNPPFHVGKRVELELPRAFLAAAFDRLERGGSLTLVANKALAYERELASWASWQELAQDRQFKVLQAVKS
jgi:16S rRNA (guanine1207-N2)-methyltransferase